MQGCPDLFLSMTVLQSPLTGGILPLPGCEIPGQFFFWCATLPLPYSGIADGSYHTVSPRDMKKPGIPGVLPDTFP